MKIYLSLFAILFASGAFGQGGEIHNILTQIEANNQELVALRSNIESEQASLEATNNLMDPQVGAYYLPFGNNTANYFEIEVSQRFEFPSVYGARGDVIDAQKVQLDQNYNIRRQEILLEAKKHCLELVYLKRILKLEQQRVEQAQGVYAQIEALFEKEQVGILELNKAKIAWLQEQFKESQISNRIQNTGLMLSRLNGGNPINFEQEAYDALLELPPLDTLLKARVVADPYSRSLAMREQVALLEYELSKKQRLPDLTAGFNYQGVPETNHAGIYAGVSIPIWSNRHNEEAALKRHLFSQVNREVYINKVQNEVARSFAEYEVLLRKYNEYQETLADLNSDELLFQAYELGEISFTVYYYELTFFRDAFNRMLEMEKALHLRRAELLKYEL